MVTRTIKKLVTGQQTVDGAGVKLVRVLSRDTAKVFDPFLMLDSFDSRNPEDYIKGFPMHPHRGIETITYLIAGEMHHQDSLENKGIIHAGESQWMTAGSGILHQEMPAASTHMLGVQLWLNLPAAKKMAAPAYNSITADKIPVVTVPGGIIRVISGTYQDTHSSIEPQYVNASIYDIILEPGSELSIPTPSEDTVFLFTIIGNTIINEQLIAVKTAVLFDNGNRIHVTAPSDAGCRFLFCSGTPLHESIAWGGPIVMNTQDELRQAFEELKNGTFIKEVMR